MVGWFLRSQDSSAQGPSATNLSSLVLGFPTQNRYSQFLPTALQGGRASNFLLIAGKAVCGCAWVLKEGWRRGPLLREVKGVGGAQAGQVSSGVRG